MTYKYSYKKGDPLNIGTIRYEYKVTGVIGRGPYGNELYRIEKLHGEERYQGFVAKVATFPATHLPPLSLPEYIEIIQNDIRKHQEVQASSLARILAFAAEEKDKVVTTCTITEFLEGIPLAEKIGLKYSTAEIKSHRLNGEELKDLLQKICSSLAVLHDNGIVHGNLKPQNIYLLSTGETKFTDPDMARMLGRQRGRHLAPEDLSSQVWLAPEQLKNPTGSYNHKCDIWSLGLIMFQMMDGSYPFPGATIQDMVHNMSSPRVSRKELPYLPASLNVLLSHSLQKEPRHRCDSIHFLNQGIASGEFIKYCINNHPNQYFELKCSTKSCGLGFRTASSDISYNLHNERWIEYQDLTGPLAVEEEKCIRFRIWPRQHPRFQAVKTLGHDIQIRFVSSDDPDLAREKLIISLLPPPVFDVEEKEIVIEKEEINPSKRITLGLVLRQSKAVIEAIEAYLNNDSGLKAPVEGEMIGRGEILSARPNPYHISLQLNAEQIPTNTAKEAAHEHDVIEIPINLVLHLKSRTEPIQLNSYTLGHPFRLRMINRPKLTVKGVRENYPIQLEIYRGRGSFQGELEVTNKGGGEIRVTKINTLTSEGANATHYIRFEPLYKGRIVRGNAYTPFKYEVFTEKIPGNNIEIYLEFDQLLELANERWAQKIRLRTFIIIKDLREGRVLAIDFGTTNSTCAAYTDDWWNPLQELALYHSADDRIVPSVIQYFSDDCGKTLIGKPAEFKFREGHLNSFRSFKRHIGVPDKCYVIYPPEALGPPRINNADDLTRDFLYELHRQAEARMGYSFKRCIFTHPSRLSLQRIKAFKKLIEEAGFEEYCLLDEATSGAIDFIAEHQGEYGLVVFDFGGGTIDITFLLVNHSPSRISVIIEDVDGIPRFGGDDVTQAIQDIVLAQLAARDYTVLMPDNPFSCMLSSSEEKEASTNNRVLWSKLEDLKKEKLFQGEKQQVHPLVRLRVKDNATGQCRDEYVTGVKFDRDEIYGRIFKKITEGVEIVHNMLEKYETSDASSGNPLKRYILLSGRSSQIPLVMEIFEAYRQGKRPFYDSQMLQFAEARESVEPYSRTKFDEVRLTDRPKGCVVRGAATYVRALKTSNLQLTVTGLTDTNFSRFGMLRGGGLLEGPVFDEWIPRRRLYVPHYKEITRVDVESGKYALMERTYKFSFFKADNGRYLLADSINIYEHLGRGRENNNTVCQRVGVFTLERPADCHEMEVDGLLRIMLTDKHDLKVQAFIINNWIDAEIISES
jgi:serine/threonine protein kinase